MQTTLRANPAKGKARHYNYLTTLTTRAANSLLQFRQETKAYLFRSSYYG